MVQEILFKAIQRTFWKQTHPIPQVNKQNMLEQAVNTEGCHASSGTNSSKLKFWHAMHWWQSPTQQQVRWGEWVHMCATGIPKIWSPLWKMRFLSKSHHFFCFFHCWNRYIRKGHLKTTKKKRVVFYIQINLYFCHKTLKANRKFSTQSFVKDPQNTLSPLRTGLQDNGLFYNLNYFLWTFFSPLSLHVQFPGTILHRSTEKQVCKGPDSESRCSLPSGEYLPVKQQQQQKTCYWKSSHKHLNQVFWICLGANLIRDAACLVPSDDSVDSNLRAAALTVPRKRRAVSENMGLGNEQPTAASRRP